MIVLRLVFCLVWMMMMVGVVVGVYFVGAGFRLLRLRLDIWSLLLVLRLCGEGFLLSWLILIFGMDWIKCEHN